MCNELRKEYEKENNIVHDIVIRTRFDIIMNNKVHYDISPGENTIYTCIGGTAGFPNDMFALGNSKIMDLYCNRIDNTIKILDKCIEQAGNSKINDLSMFCGHYSMKMLAENNNINYDNRKYYINIIRPLNR